MSVKRAIESRELTRSGFCKLLVNIATDHLGLYKEEYGDELARYMRSIPIDNVGAFYDLDVDIEDTKDGRVMSIEIPVEFRNKDLDTNHVTLLLDKPDIKLKFSVRNPKK